jgi:hypothetical protein
MTSYMCEQSVSPPDPQEPIDSLEAELLAALTAGDAPPYPENLSALEAEAYFEQLEADFSLLDGLELDEIASQADNFLAKLHQFWESEELRRKK